MIPEAMATFPVTLPGLLQLVGSANPLPPLPPFSWGVGEGKGLVTLACVNAARMVAQSDC